MYACWYLDTCRMHLHNQSIKVYKAPLQDPYSEVLPTQTKRKRSLEKVVELRKAPFGRCLRSIGSPFQVVGKEKERACIVAERANGTTKNLVKLL